MKVAAAVLCLVIAAQLINVTIGAGRRWFASLSEPWQVRAIAAATVLFWSCVAAGIAWWITRP